MSSFALSLLLFLASFYLLFLGNSIIVLHDVGFLDAAIELDGLTTLFLLPERD